MQKRDDEWKKTLFDRLYRACLIFGAVLMGGILVFLMFRERNPLRLLNNRWLFLIVIGVMSLIGLFYIVVCDREKKRAVRHPVLWLAGVYALLYCLQAVLVAHAYFYVGWDASYMGWAAESVVMGGSMAECSAEVIYSLYPNNLLPFYMLYLIEKLGLLFFQNGKDLYILCVYASCLGVNLSCFLGHLVVRRLLRSRFLQALYLLLGGIFFLTSPWSMVPYTDSFGMFFVMLGVWGLFCCENRYLKWGIVSFAGVIGYHVKPTVIFVLFAAVLIYGIRGLFDLRRRWRELIVLAAGTVAFWLIGLCIPLWIQHTFHAHLVPEARFTVHHYLMMGLNEENTGTYNDEDYWFTRMQPNVETRKQADMEVFWERLDKLVRERRLGWLLSEKAGINFDSGSMWWERDGALFKGGVEHHNALAELYGQVVDLDGKYLPFYLTLQQGIWLACLLGILFAVLDGRAGRAEKACMMTMLCGLAVFVMLFEARARYLYLYSPVFLLLALCGYEAVFSRAAGGIHRIFRKSLVFYDAFV